jgi:hypothetical protein
MATFLLIHHFPPNFQGSPESAAAARDWFARLGGTVPGPGDAAVDGAAANRLGDCGTAPERRLAYTLISTDDLDAATGFAKAWPPLARGGGVEIREIPILTPAVEEARTTT